MAGGVNRAGSQGGGMNGRRRFFSTIGLGFLLAGGAAAAAREDRASTAEPQRTLAPIAPQQTLAPIAPQQRAQYKVFTIPAGDTVEDVFNAVAQENFQYAGWVRRYGDTEFIFVKWVPVEPVPPEDTSSPRPPAGFDDAPSSQTQASGTAPVRGNLQEISSSASCVAIRHPITLALPAHRH